MFGLTKRRLLMICIPLVAILGISQTDIPSGGLYVLNAAGTRVIEFFDTGDSTFTGDVTANAFIGDGSGLTGVSGGFTSTDITSKTQVTPVATDFIIGTDASDGDALKKFDIADILGAGGGITDGDTLTSGLTFPNTGLHILDTNDSHALILRNNFDLTADRTLNIVTGDTDRTITLDGNTTLSGTNTGDQTITLTGDVTGSGTGSFAATIAAAAVDMAMLNTSGTPDGTKFLRDDGAWTAVSGSGDVSKVGTPVDGQIGVWTGDGTIEGDASLTFDTTDDTLVIAASGKLGFGAVDIFTDSAGTLTLNNLDALDATSESTIEAAIDTLANLTSIQGNAVTVAGTTSITGTNTGDVSLAGTPDYITISGQTITRGLLDLSTDVTGDLPLANIAQFAQGTIAGRAAGAGTGDLTALNLGQILAITSEDVAGVTSTTNSVAWNSDDAIYFSHTTTENTTIAAGGGTERELQSAVFVITQGATPRTLSWNAEFVAGDTFSGTIPAVGTEVGDISVYMYKWFPSPTSKWILFAHMEY